MEGSLFVDLRDLEDEDEILLWLHLPCLIQIVPPEKAPTHSREEGRMPQKHLQNQGAKTSVLPR